jgi:hypothetical protein
MDFMAKLARARESYREFFAQTLRELRARGESPVTELLVEPHGVAAPAPFNLCRPDILLGTPERSRWEWLIDGEPAGQDEVQHTLDSGLRVTAGWVGWESVRVSFYSSAFRLDALADWLYRWLDVAETHAEDADGLLGVVHGLASASEGERWTLEVDFGSAPLDAAVEFLRALHASGVTDCRVSPPDPGRRSAAT